jgi:hypothetical protein
VSLALVTNSEEHLAFSRVIANKELPFQLCLNLVVVSNTVFPFHAELNRSPKKMKLLPAVGVVYMWDNFAHQVGSSIYFSLQVLVLIQYYL